MIGIFGVYPRGARDPARGGGLGPMPPARSSRNVPIADELVGAGRGAPGGGGGGHLCRLGGRDRSGTPEGTRAYPARRKIGRKRGR